MKHSKVMPDFPLDEAHWFSYHKNASMMIIEFFTIGVSVRLSDRSLHREEQKKIRQKLPPVGIDTRTSGSSGQCLTN